ncbi:2-octaprenyl-6-methoxyphenol hydroxylase [Loktanella fryxellensis]|uniref:2-octaprenyl-6-methoxyphenol hydroxylase n=1 Tax=Loktanella fryxellensis TaxID=245187 RepID=A0A1H8GF34_9RHOB|nr:FAD-dependent monooxygenase [Loktanella fryxellensis]SEN42395.1 2-octaprenyl-6-methoxyphenol hydroxylase [Loktanella fryxellensis]
MAYIRGMDTQHTDILISGGGVAGLAAAAAFGAAGFTVTLVDPAPPVTDAATDGADLRTTAFLQPAQAFLDRAGVWDAVAPHATALQTMRIVDAGRDPAVTRDFVAADISDAPFGWNVPNWLIRRVLVDRIAALPGVTLRTGVGFEGMVPRLDTAIVRLTDGTRLRARLVIGADGRNSAVRQAAGIDVTTTRYGQKAITFAVTHPAPHDGVSTEVHQSGGPFTLVPLPDHDGQPCSSVVWMDGGARIAALAAMDDASFTAAANARSHGVNGPLTLVGKRSVWPIVSQIADRITAPRTALVAEAAHVMPPIGAQGLNMSLADMAGLLDLSVATPDALGEAPMLAAYARARHGDMRLRVTGIDALNRASIAVSPLVHDLRALGVRALHDVAPVRRRLMRLGLGAR